MNLFKYLSATSLILLLFSNFALAEQKYKSEDAVHAEITIGISSSVKLRVDQGFHINDKAPNKIQILPNEKAIAASSLDAKHATFSFGKPADSDQVKLSVYVCDDALTTCEERTWIWNGRGKDLGKPETKHGFLQDKLSMALEECKETHKQILLLFSARWCPGCMRMEKEIWTKPEFKSALDKFIKVHLDADRFVNKPIMESYAVPAIPTTLILNCDGEELERIVDYQQPASFIRALKSIAANKTLIPHSVLVKKASAGDGASALILATRAALTGADVEALKWYAFVPNRENELGFWSAAVDELSQKNEKFPSEDLRKSMINLTQSAIEHFPSTPTSLDWRASLAELQGADTKDGMETLNSLIQLCDDLIKNPSHMKAFNRTEPAGDYLGIESLKVFQAKAEALAALKNTAEEKLAWKAGVLEGKRLRIKDEPSGQFFRFLVFLKRGGESERLRTFFIKFLEKNPNDPELLRRYAKLLYDEGDFKQSAEKALQSIAGSYDQNEIFAATLYAKALAKNGEAPKAKTLLQKYLARSDLPTKAKSEISSTLSGIK